MIRTRTDLDLPDCVAVLARVHELDGFPKHWPEDAAGWLAPPDMVRAWVYTVDGAIVGHAMVRLPRGGGHTFNRLFVAPRGRGAGAGKALVDKAARWASGQGIGLGLEVNAEQTAAVALYERTGWRRVSTGPAAWDSEVTVHHYTLGGTTSL